MHTGQQFTCGRKKNSESYRYTHSNTCKRWNEYETDSKRMENVHRLRTEVERNTNGFWTDNERLMNGNEMERAILLNGQETGICFRAYHTVLLEKLFPFCYCCTFLKRVIICVPFRFITILRFVSFAACV